MDYQSIIDEYYPSENELRRILMVHSRQVADRCLLIASKHPELRLDKEFLEEAAMLHDIGIYRTNAPGIQCFGTEPYIRHGLIGGQILREKGWERHARVCERHTGTGLTAWDIEQQQLPLPHEDLGSERSVVEAMRALEKFGWDGIRRFQKWVDMFE